MTTWLPSIINSEFKIFGILIEAYFLMHDRVSYTSEDRVQGNKSHRIEFTFMFTAYVIWTRRPMAISS